ncbi:MAG: SH3 domain-containing protein, partial [Clostridiales bacterium]|nr:SH3 domain-containing protein [Clostridiales bacterium]
MASHRRHKKKKRRQHLIIAVIVIVIVIIIVAAMGLATVFNKYSPSKTSSDYASFYGLDSDDQIIVNMDHEILDGKALYIDGEVYIPYGLLHDRINARFYWDDTEDILRYVLPEGVVSVDAETAAYAVAKENRTFDHTIVHIEDGEMYLSLSFIEQYTDIRSSFYEEPNRVVISDNWDEEEFTLVKSSAAVRELGGVKSDILTNLSKGDSVTVLDEMDSWTKVCTEDGFIGYVQNKVLGDTYSQIPESAFVEPIYTHTSRDYTINMAWHQVTNQAANNSVSSVIGSATGLNVISPTWFYLDDDYGGIASLASSDYVNYCHSQGVEVWALVSNIENPDVDTTTVLSV